MSSLHEPNNDQSEDYEPIELEEHNHGYREASFDDESVKGSLRLPAKALSPRRSLLPFAIAASLAFASIVSTVVLLHYIPGFVPDSELYNTWISDDNAVSCDLTNPSNSTIENTFVINLRSGAKLSFAEAKIIDVIWDLVVGQGGRLLMAWAAYRVFMDALVSLLEATPVSYDLYAALVFETTSLLATWKAMKALFKLRNWRSRIFLTWFCLTTVYVLAFPTLMGAATGYVTPSYPGYSMPDGNTLVATSDDLTQCYDLLAGALIGEKNGTIVTGPQASVTIDSTNDTLKAQYADYLYLANYTTYDPSHINITDNSSLSSNSPYYITSSYYLATHNYTSTITWHNHTYTFHNWTFTSGTSTSTGIVSSSYGSPAFVSGYCYKDTMLPGDLKRLSKCMPRDFFVWGFSSKLLQIILSLQIAWIFVMLFIWLHANMTSQLLFKNRAVRGHFRAIADLAEAMRGTLGDETCAYTDNEIAAELKRERNGVRYYTADDKGKGISHIGLGNQGGVGLDSSRLYGGRRRRRF